MSDLSGFPHILGSFCISQTTLLELPLKFYLFLQNERKTKDKIKVIEVIEAISSMLFSK